MNSLATLVTSNARQPPYSIVHPTIIGTGMRHMSSRCTPTGDTLNYKYKRPMHGLRG